MTSLFNGKPIFVSFLQDEDSVVEMEKLLQTPAEQLDRYQLEDCVIYLREVAEMYKLLYKEYHDKYELLLGNFPATDDRPWWKRIFK